MSNHLLSPNAERQARPFSTAGTWGRANMFPMSHTLVAVLATERFRIGWVPADADIVYMRWSGVTAAVVLAATLTVDFGYESFDGVDDDITYFGTAIVADGATTANIKRTNLGGNNPYYLTARMNVATYNGLLDVVVGYQYTGQ